MGVLTPVQQNSHVFRDVFCATTDHKLTDEAVEKLLDVESSELGSKLRFAELQMITYWKKSSAP